jgi:adenylate kinase
LGRRGKIFKVIYITGTPGTGKTTVASALAASTGSRHVDLGKLSVEKGLILRRDPLRKTGVVDLEKLSRFLGKHFQSEKRNLILQAHFSAKLPPKLKPKSVLVLRCEPGELAERLKTKGFPAEKISENIWAEILDYCLQEALHVYGPSRIHEIDTTGRKVEEVVAEALAVLEERKKPQIGVCHWLQSQKIDRKFAS